LPTPEESAADADVDAEIFASFMVTMTKQEVV